MKTWLLILTMMACGCGQQVVLHPIEMIDIISVPAGSVLHVPERTDPIKIEKSGWYLSDVYVTEVMQAKVE